MQMYWDYNQRSMKKVIFTLLVILWMAVIFSFSAKPADQSEEMSQSVGRKIGELFEPGFEKWPESEQMAYAERIDYPVRKCAHATEYIILGILLMAVGESYRIGKKLRLAFVIGAAYACSDEIHQLFVPGRSGQVTDVLIDCTGLLVGIILVLLIQHIYNYITRNKKQ